MICFTRAFVKVWTEKSCWLFLKSNQTEALFLTLFISSLCSHATAKAPWVFHCFVCSSKSQSHLFGNWLHSAALISIWNRQQHFALTAWTGPTSHAASSRFQQRAASKQDDIDKKLEDISQAPPPTETTGRFGEFGLLVYRCFHSGWPWEASLCFTFVELISGNEFYCTLLSTVHLQSGFFKGDTFSYESASLLAPFLCHCNFTVGFKAFGGVHSNENSSTAPLCWSVVGCPYLPTWAVQRSLLLWV